MKHLLCAVLAVAGLTSTGIAAAGECKDPWVTKAVKEVLKRSPMGEGNSGECNIQKYGNGRWSSYNDLVAKVRAANGIGIAGAATKPGGGQNLAGNMVNRNGAGVVSAGGGNVVSGGGANVVSGGGANVVSAGGRN